MAWTGARRPAIRLSAVIGIVALTALHNATPVAAASPADSGSATTTASVTVVDSLTLMKFSDIDVGGVTLPVGEYAALELLADRSLAHQGGVVLPAQDSFSAVFTLTGSPNQTFGISLPGSITLSNGGSTQSVRTFLHDAGQVPVLATTGRTRFHVGAILSVGRTSSDKTEVYIGAFDVIISNN